MHERARTHAHTCMGSWAHVIPRPNVKMKNLPAEIHHTSERRSMNYTY